MADQEITSSLPDWIAAHVELYRQDPERGHDWDSTAVGGPGVLPCLLLTTRGRKSGNQRVLPLIYGRQGDDYVVIASKGGAPEHPAWYLNLLTEPDCHMQVRSEHIDARARTAEGEEREELWQQLALIYPPYNDYQVSAGDREIPVVVLGRR
jgi:deazaflavin-dependent oxidoreductase (nitroreductase family)